MAVSPEINVVIQSCVTNQRNRPRSSGIAKLDILLPAAASGAAGSGGSRGGGPGQVLVVPVLARPPLTGTASSAAMS